MDGWVIAAVVCGWYFAAAVVVRFLPRSWFDTPYTELHDLGRAGVWILSPITFTGYTAYGFFLAAEWLLSPPKKGDKS